MTEPTMRKGTPLSAGIGRGIAFMVGHRVERGLAPPGPAVAELELRRFRAACERSEASLLRLRGELAAPLAAAAEGILGGQQLMLRDPAFIDLVEVRLRQGGRTAEEACMEVVGELAAAVEAASDPYLRERAGDVRDIGQRVLAELAGEELAREIPPGSVVVTRELHPSLVARLRPEDVRGVVTELGARASHASILLRSTGIPAVGGVVDALAVIKPGCRLLVDGVAGLVFVAPSRSVEDEYACLEAELRGHDEMLAGETRLPAVTLDGLAVHLATNLGKSADAEAALHWNAESVGLYRTEFAFGIRDRFPTEEEQTAILAGVAERLHPRPIVFRLLDLGAEKRLPYLPLLSCANPALGLRGTRLLLAHQQVLRTQLRAILRVSATHAVSALLPMVGGVEEVRAVRRILVEETRLLAASGLGVAEALPLGAMIEIPSAVLMARELAQETEFLSLGSNDLAQYLLAADRDDPAMSGYYRMLHPAVLRAIHSVVRSAARAQKELTICGEAAGDPAYTEVLLGLGLRRFSASPRQLGELRHTVRNCHAGRARAFAQRLLRCATRDEVREALDRRGERPGSRGAGIAPPPSGASSRNPEE